MYKTDNPQMCVEKKTDCFAYHDGKCVALSDTKFNRPCPFYKTRKGAYFVGVYEEDL